MNVSVKKMIQVVTAYKRPPVKNYDKCEDKITVIKEMLHHVIPVPVSNCYHCTLIKYFLIVL